MAGAFRIFNPAVPGALGGTTPAAGTFTSLTARVSLSVGVASATAGALTLYNASNAFTTTIQGGVVSANKTWVWPTAFGSAGQALVDAAGDGILSFAAAGMTAAQTNLQQLALLSSIWS